MNSEVIIKSAKSISEYIEFVEQFNADKSCEIYFRGEPDDYGETAFQPSVYRKNYLKNEHRIYREMQRFNDYEFASDRTSFDRISRMQHFLTPSRLIDLSEDALTSLYFAVSERKLNQKAIVYAVAIDAESIKYYDSDTVSILSNLCKTPLDNVDNSNKSKRAIYEITREALNKNWSKDQFNAELAIQYLLHDVRDDVSHFKDLINPRHIFSVQCVKPKLANTRIYGQKGAFLLFGLSSIDVNKSIPIFERNKNVLQLHRHVFHTIPIRGVLKIEISNDVTCDNLRKLGISTPYVYPGLEKVSGYLSDEFK